MKKERFVKRRASRDSKIMVSELEFLVLELIGTEIDQSTGDFKENED